MALSLSDIVAQKNASLSKSLNPLGQIGKVQALVQLAQAPVKAGVSLADIAQTNKQAATPLISTVPQPKTTSLASFIPEKKPSSIGDYIVSGAKKLGEYGKKVEEFGTLIPQKQYSLSEKTGAGIFKAVGSFMRSPDELFNSIGNIATKVGEGKLSQTEGIAQSILQTGMTSLGTFYAPVQIGVNSALNATESADAVAKAIASGRDTSSKFLQDTFDISKDKADSYVDDVYNVTGIATGALGGGIMSKGLKNIKTAPIKGTAQVGAGVITQNAPDVIMALIGVAADKEGKIPSKEQIAKGLGITTLAGALPGAALKEPKKTKLTEAIPETNILEQGVIAQDRAMAEKQAPSKTTGTIDIKAFQEFRKTNPSATPSDFMKSQTVEVAKPTIKDYGYDLQNRPAIVKKQGDKYVVLQGTGRFAKATGDMDIFLPKGETIPEGFSVVKSDIPNDIVKETNLLSSRGEAGTNPKMIEFITKGNEDWVQLRGPKEKLTAPLFKQKATEVVKPVEVIKPIAKKDKVTVEKINQAIAQLEKQNENMAKRVKQQPALANNIRENVNKINIFKKELERKTQAQMEGRAKKVPVSDIISQKPDETVAPALTPDMGNVEMLAERARQNRQIGLEMRKVIEGEQSKSKTLTDKIQDNRMKEIYDDFVRNRLSQDDLSTKIIDDTTLTEQNKESLINSFSDILSSKIAEAKPEKQVKDARYNELLDETTAPEGLDKGDMAMKIKSDTVIDDKQKSKLLKGIGFDKKQIEEVLTVPERERPTIIDGPFGPIVEKKSTIGSAGNIIDQSYLPSDKSTFEVKPGASKNISRATNLDTYLSNVKMNINGVYTGTLNRFVQGLKNVGKQVANKLADEFGIKNEIKEISKNKELIDSTWNNIAKDMKTNLIDGITPNEGIKITSENVDTAIQTLKEGDNLDYAETYSDLKNADINNVAKIGYIYDLFKGNQEKLNQLIPPELQTFYSKLDELNRNAYDNIGQDAVNRDLLKEYNLEDEYVRFVMLPEARKRIEGFTGKSVFTTSDGIEHKSFLDMETHVKAMNKAGKTITPMFDITKLSSILKDKKSGVDLYRFNSPVAQILDYMRQYGELNKNDSIFKVFDELSQSKDPKIKKYIEGMYESKVYQNPLEQIINLGGRDTNIATQAVQKLQEIGVKGVLYTGVDTLIQATTQGTVRNLALGKLPGKVVTDRAAKNILDQYGITQGFELSSLGGLAGSKNVALFSGAGIENMQKAAVAVPMMRDFVELIEPTTGKRSDTEVIKDFDRIMKDADIGTRAKILDSIYEQTNFVSNISSLARSSINVLNKYGFTALKSFDTNMVGQLQQNIQNTIFGGGTSSRMQTGIRILIPLIAAIAVQQAYVQINKEDDKEGKDVGLLKEQGNQVAQQFVGNPFVNARDFVGGLLGNISNLPVDFIKQSINALLLLKNEDKEMAAKLGVNSLIDLLLRKLQLGQIINKGTLIVGNKTMDDLISDKLGVTNLENQSAKLNAKGFKLDSGTESVLELIGVRLDAATQNYLYKTMAEEKTAQDYPNATTPGQILISYVMDTKNKLQRDAENFFLNPYSWGNIGQYNDQMMEQGYVAATMRNKDDNNTMSDFLNRVGISGELREGIVGAEKSNLKAIRTTNKNIEKAIGTFFFQYGIEGDTFSEQLNNLEEINPKAFNNFISGIARTKFYLDNNPELDISNKQTLEAIKPFFQESTTYTDAAISDYSGKSPLSTALTESLQRNLFDFKDKLGQKGGIEKAKSALGDIEKVYNIILGNEKHTDGIINAASLKSIELQQSLTEMRKQGYTTFNKDFPILTDVIMRGLELRGEAISKGSKQELQDEEQLFVAPTTTPEQAIGTPSLRSLLTTKLTEKQGTLLLPEKQKKTPKLGDLIKQQSYQPQPLTSQKIESPSSTSLSEIVRRINLGKNLK